MVDQTENAIYKHFASLLTPLNKKRLKSMQGKNPLKPSPKSNPSSQQLQAKTHPASKRRLKKMKLKKQRRLKKIQQKSGGAGTTERLDVASVIADLALKRNDYNIASRHVLIQTAAELSRLDFQVLKNLPSCEIKLPPTLTWPCYCCKQEASQRLHNEYIYCCKDCGDMLKRNRYLSRDLHGQVALVTGARTKLGYQIALKLLRAGAAVIATSREPDRALLNYQAEFDYDNWRSRLFTYGIDFLTPRLNEELDDLKKFVETTFQGQLNIVVNNAAQTIRKPDETARYTQKTNRYNDPAHYPDGLKSSWVLNLGEVSLAEFEEVFRVNAIAPATLITKLSPLLVQSTSLSNKRGYIINVHAREGLFGVRKSRGHMHTNMAKAAMAMLTNCLAQRGFQRSIRVHGVDPGWISIDEYCSDICFYPALDEVDGAAKILYPLWKELKSTSQTRRHYDQLLF